MEQLIEELQKRIEKAKEGGGKEKMEKLRKAGKLTARERIDYLFDNNTENIEIGTLSGENMYEEYGGCPSGGVIVKIGYISEKMCIAVANDASVKAGAWFPVTLKKNLRAQEISMENNIPIIYLVDSAGIFLPLQDEIFADKEHFGRIFRNNAKMSNKGITQISAVMGSCVAGGAYLPVMSDETIIVEGTGSLFLAGSYLVKSAIGENVNNEILGGAETHCSISGVTDYKAKNDKEAIDIIKKLVAKIGDGEKAGFNRKKSVDPKRSIEDIKMIISENKDNIYDMKEVIECIVDDSEMDEYKRDYGKTIICAYARIDGWAVGIVANQKTIEKNAKSELQYGGVIYSESADKATRFIANCNQKKIPLLFLQDVNGFMIGTKAEHGGIIKDGAKMVNAVANSVVPKFTIIVGNSFGAGNYAMCGKAYDPRFILAYPNAKIAVMGGDQAGKTLLQMEKMKLETQNQEIIPEKEKQLLEEIKNKYEKEMSVYNSAAKLQIDEIIDPNQTRKWISMGIEIANHKPIDEKFNMGILQV